MTRSKQNNRGAVLPNSSGNSMGATSTRSRSRIGWRGGHRSSRPPSRFTLSKANSDSLESDSSKALGTIRTDHRIVRETRSTAVTQPVVVGQTISESRTATGAVQDFLATSFPRRRPAAASNCSHRTKPVSTSRQNNRMSPFRSPTANNSSPSGVGGPKKNVPAAGNPGGSSTRGPPARQTTRPVCTSRAYK